MVTGDFRVNWLIPCDKFWLLALSTCWLLVCYGFSIPYASSPIFIFVHLLFLPSFFCVSSFSFSLVTQHLAWWWTFSHARVWHLTVNMLMVAENILTGETILDMYRTIVLMAKSMTTNLVSENLQSAFKDWHGLLCCNLNMVVSIGSNPFAPYRTPDFFLIAVSRKTFLPLFAWVPPCVW